MKFLSLENLAEGTRDTVNRYPFGILVFTNYPTHSYQIWV